MKATRTYPKIEGDDDREMYCQSCECNVHTVPAEGVPNQELRACSQCGSTDVEFMYYHKH